MSEPTVRPIGPIPDFRFGGFLPWGSTPPAEAAESRAAYMTKDPLTESVCIWNWEAGCWVQFGPLHTAEAYDAVCRDRDHWRANHDRRVEAARVLIERPDLPLERVDAYRKYLAALTRAAELEAENRELRQRALSPDVAALVRGVRVGDEELAAAVETLVGEEDHRVT